MITYNVDGVKMPKIKKRDTSAWIRKVAFHQPVFSLPLIATLCWLGSEIERPQ